MNERIKELKDQCWVERRWNNDIWIEKHIDLELFAELIIKECAAQANTKILNNLRPNETHQLSYNEGLRDGVAEFKKYFKAIE